jgi:hypothetical protein
MKALKQHNSTELAGAYPYFIRLGKAGSEDALIDALNTSGDLLMAQAFLQSGNAKLVKAGREWSSEEEDSQLYVITDYEGSHWGRARE